MNNKVEFVTGVLNEKLRGAVGLPIEGDLEYQGDRRDTRQAQLARLAEIKPSRPPENRDR